MKKKGLIISTIVMVVVLIASLTTATYAWFNTSSVTSIEGFNVSIASNNAVKIGLKANNTYVADPSEDLFVTGSVEYTAGTAGNLGGGTWAGDSGLSASIDHNIVWGEQGKAVGFSADAVAVATGATSLLSSGPKSHVYAANGDNSASTLNSITAAVANNDGSDKSDYVYIFLGVAPTRALTSSELVILVNGNQAGSGTTLGVLAALHVAYRLNSTGAWTDVDVFGSADNYVQDETVTNTAGHYYYETDHYVECTGAGSPEATFTKHDYHYNTLKTAVVCNLTTALTHATVNEAATYVATYGGSAPTTGAQAVKIALTGDEVNEIDQVEILIYIDGSDSDCRQTAISNVAGAINIFFHTTEA